MPRIIFYLRAETLVDETRVKRLAERLRKGPPPDFLVLHLVGLDHAGHRHGVKSAGYADIARRTVAHIENIVRLLPPDTVVLLTSDHGATDSGGHGGASEVETTAPLFAFGPGIVAGARVNINQIDLAPTLSCLMGLPFPTTSLGRPAVELFDEPAPARLERLRAGLSQVEQAWAKPTGVDAGGDLGADPRRDDDARALDAARSGSALRGDPGGLHPQRRAHTRARRALGTGLADLSDRADGGVADAALEAGGGGAAAVVCRHRSDRGLRSLVVARPRTLPGGRLDPLRAGRVEAHAVRLAGPPRLVAERGCRGAAGAGAQPPGATHDAPVRIPFRRPAGDRWGGPLSRAPRAGAEDSGVDQGALLVFRPDAADCLPGRDGRRRCGHRDRERVLRHLAALGRRRRLVGATRGERVADARGAGVWCAPDALPRAALAPRVDSRSCRVDAGRGGRRALRSLAHAAAADRALAFARDPRPPGSRSGDRAFATRPARRDRRGDGAGAAARQLPRFRAARLVA